MKKIIISALSAILGAIVGAGSVGRIKEEEKIKVQKMSDKHLVLFLMMNQWVKVKQGGKNLASFFEINGYHKIAIYGMSYAGKTLVDELKGTNIKVLYGIDKSEDSLYEDIKVVSLEDSLESVDAVVITAITFFEEIEENLSKKMECPIISLEDILYQI